MTTENPETQSEVSIKADIEELRRVISECQYERGLCWRIACHTIPVCDDHQYVQARRTELEMTEFKARVALSNAWATLRKIQGRTFSELCARYAAASEA
jgi:hypothetical protein